MSQQGKFSILTYNLWLHYLPNSPNKDHRIKHFLKNISKYNYDVLALQEVFVMNIFGYTLGIDIREQLIKESKNYGYEYHLMGDTPPTIFGQTSGLLILSKYPILKGAERRWYKVSDFGTAKGFLHAIIQIGGEEVHVFNVHLDAHYPETRSMQLYELCTKFLPHLSNKIVIAGDFNVSTQDIKEYADMIRIISSYGLRDAYDSIEGCSISTHNKKGCIDHILISSNIELHFKDLVDFRDSEGERISDHSGVSANLRLAM